MRYLLIVHNILTNVSIFLPFQDQAVGTPVTLRVDSKGFYLNWLDQNNELDLLDIVTIRDVRTGQYAKKPKVRPLYGDYMEI